MDQNTTLLKISGETYATITIPFNPNLVNCVFYIILVILSSDYAMVIPTAATSGEAQLH